MTGDENDSDDVQSDRVPVAETLDELLASDDSGLCAGLLDVLAMLSDVGAARWVLHRAGDLALAAAPGGYGCHEVFASQVIDAAVKELAEARLLTIEEASFGDADADDADDSDPDGTEAERAGRGDEAIGTFAGLLTDKEDVLPADDRGVLDARDDLALAHMNAGRYPEAVSQYTELLADYERVAGPRDSLTLSVRGALGEAYLEVGPGSRPDSRGDRADGGRCGRIGSDLRSRLPGSHPVPRVHRRGTDQAPDGPVKGLTAIAVR